MTSVSSPPSSSSEPTAPSLQWAVMVTGTILLLLYIGLVLYDFRWLSRSDTDLEAYAVRHYPTEIGSLPATRDSVRVFPLGLITELHVERSSEPVPSSPGVPANQPGLRYSAQPRALQWFFLTVVYVTLSGVAMYAVWVFGVVFRSTGMLGPVEVSTVVHSRELSWRVLSRDVENLQRVIHEIDRRSILFLSVGSIIGIIGVGVLLTALPHTVRAGASTAETMVGLTRSIALAAFVEGIAWFFLRQHRVLIEDRKSFIRLCLRRTNHMATLGLIQSDTSEVPELRAAMVNALLRDPMVDRLRQGETTEAVEVLRALSTSGEGPAAQMLALLKDYLPKPTAPGGST